MVTALVDYLAGDGDSLDAAAARDAACDLIDDLFGEVSDYEELNQSQGEMYISLDFTVGGRPFESQR